VWSDMKRYQRASSAHRHLLWEALFALAIARIVMACVPFKRIASWLGKPGAETPATATPEETHTAEAIGWAVGVLGRRVPWDGRCLAQALAATSMLRRRGLEGTVTLGVREGKSASFDAHAWLRMGSCIVTGGPGHEEFKPFTTFARRQS
jgi:transglutaminase-like putative cysteine protease